MSKLPPLYTIRTEYKCRCGGDVASKALGWNDVHWLCMNCGENDTVDDIEYPSHFVVRKMKMNKTIRELVEEEFKKRHSFYNKAVLYDDPQPLPDVDSMSDEELWASFLKFTNTGPIG